MELFYRLTGRFGDLNYGVLIMRAFSWQLMKVKYHGPSMMDELDLPCTKFETQWVCEDGVEIWTQETELGYGIHRGGWNDAVIHNELPFICSVIIHGNFFEIR